MKKTTLLACACAFVFGAQSLVAQESAQEVTYVSDPTQGYVFNRFKDNWFITAEGGADIYFANHGSHRDLADRFSPAASLYVGKWFSPLLGVRVGANFLALKGLATAPSFVGTNGQTVKDDGEMFYKTKCNEVGPVFDVMLNLTNWWCGYKPNRVYNATVYAGGGMYVTMTKHFNADGSSAGYKNAHDAIMSLRCGLINSFNVSKQVQLSLDLRWSLLEGLPNEGGAGWNQSCLL